MGRLTVLSRQVSKNYKQTVLEHPGKLAMGKHCITIGQCSQHHSPYTCVYSFMCYTCFYTYCFNSSFYCIWFPSPVPFRALLFTPISLLSIFLHHTSHWSNQNSALIHALVLPLCLVCTWLIHQP